jgi:hypothetical protein
MSAVTLPEGGGRGDNGLAGSEFSNATALQPLAARVPPSGGMTDQVECFTMCVSVRFTSPQQ